MKFQFLKAFNGDSILFSVNSPDGGARNILIDGGIADTYMRKGKKGKKEFGELKKTIDLIRAKGELIDLLIITHIDDDHIEGILTWFNEDKDAYKLINEIWFNDGASIAKYLNETENADLKHFINPDKIKFTSINQGIEFSTYIKEKRILKKDITLQGDIISRLGLEFFILSPNRNKLCRLIKEWKKKDPDLKTSYEQDDYSISLSLLSENDRFVEDTAYPNGSSLAFILKLKERCFLFLGDSHPSVIIEGLIKLGFSETKRLNAEFVKISHHGSKGNTSTDLLKFINSNKFIISTSGKIHNHPHKQFLARLIKEKNNCEIYFNYPERMDKIFSDEDKIDFPNFQYHAISNQFEYGS